jgi:hypothetical protein
MALYAAVLVQWGIAMYGTGSICFVRFGWLQLQVGLQPSEGHVELHPAHTARVLHMRACCWQAIAS